MAKYNFGCGPIQPQCWINVDGSKRAWLASRLSLLDSLLVKCRILSPTEFTKRTVWADLTKTFPWGDNSADAIYMGEILEHFTADDGAKVIRECARILKPQGVLRIRVPDHARFWENYIAEYREIKSRPRNEWTLDHTRWTSMHFETICIKPPKPWQSFGHFHKWMYDDVSLIRLLEQVGFSDVDRKHYHESTISGIEEVEARDDLIVEATKPQISAGSAKESTKPVLVQGV